MTVKTLLQLATEINAEFAKIKTNYVVLGAKLKITRDRVKIESDMSWRQWCHNYLRKADGTEFSYKTIENYIYLAGDPDRVIEQRRMQRENIRKIRKSAQAFNPGMNVLFDRANSVNDQVNILMSAWDCASEKAQTQFLEMIGARL